MKIQAPFLTQCVPLGLILALLAGVLAAMISRIYVDFSMRWRPSQFGRFNRSLNLSPTSRLNTVRRILEALFKRHWLSQAEQTRRRQDRFVRPQIM